MGEINHGPVPWRLGRPSSALLCPALVWLTAAVFDLDLAPPGSRPLACDEGPSLRVMSLVYVDWSAVGLSLGNANRFLQWCNGPHALSRERCGRYKSRVEHPLPGILGGVTSIPVADVPSNPSGAGRRTRARTPDAAFEWSQGQRPCPAPPTLELSPRIESHHAARKRPASTVVMNDDRS